MGSLAEQILTAIRHEPLDDDVLARRLGLAHRQSVNQVARQLEARGLLRRVPGPDGKLVNVLTGPDALAAAPPIPPAQPGPAAGPMGEDAVKRAVQAHLHGQGFTVHVAWGRSHGVDLDAVHPDGRRYLVEAKGEVGRSGPQQANYFLGALGELVQRMEDPNARYALALPAHRQYRNLVGRLPALAWERLRLSVFWVHRADVDPMVVLEESPPGS